MSRTAVNSDFGNRYVFAMMSARFARGAAGNFAKNVGTVQSQKCTSGFICKAVKTMLRIN